MGATDMDTSLDTVNLDGTAMAAASADSTLAVMATAEFTR